VFRKVFGPRRDEVENGGQYIMRNFTVYITVSRTAMGPTQPPIQWVPGALSLGVKWPGQEADHSLPSSAEDKNVWSYTSTPPICLMAWCSSEAQGQLYLYQLPSRDVVREVKSRKLWASCIAWTGETNAYINLLGKPLGKWLLGREKGMV
jgi:hypothetical protein